MNSYRRTKQYRDGRIVLSENDWKKLRSWAWWFYETIYGAVCCHMCGQQLYEFCQMALDHYIRSRGAGGAFRDDRFVLPACHECNGKKQSVVEVSPRLDLPPDVRRWRISTISTGLSVPK